MSDDILIQSVEAAVAAQTTETELSEFGALTAMSALEVAEERLASAVQTLQRTTAALRVLRGLAAPLPTAPAAIGSPNRDQLLAQSGVAAAPAPLPIDTTKPPDMGTDREPGQRAEIEQNNPANGIQCPGCGKYGTIVRIDGYKGTPYSVLQCTTCSWERNT